MQRAGEQRDEQARAQPLVTDQAFVVASGDAPVEPGNLLLQSLVLSLDLGRGLHGPAHIAGKQEGQQHRQEATGAKGHRMNRVHAKAGSGGRRIQRFYRQRIYRFLCQM